LELKAKLARKLKEKAELEASGKGSTEKSEIALSKMMSPLAAEDKETE
jgi:hypothetical protein